jgi:alpha-L-fucosidase
MIKRVAILSLFTCFNFSIFAQQPSTIQLSQIKRGYGMFIHFGLNTFNEMEWSDGKLPVSSYNPDKLNCDQWVKTAKDAGFRYVILITKHHDGFCLWDSKYTDYDVAASPVKTDVVAEVAKACKKYGLELGLYYSLWDRHEPSHNDPDPNVYLKYMKNQLTELLTSYGKICEIWFDGAWAKNDTAWHIPEVYAHIKKLQPNCLITVNHTIENPGEPSSVRMPLAMKAGDPIRFFPVDFRTKDPNIARWDDPKLYSYERKNHYLTFEHTLCLSDRWNWFQKKEMIPARSADELEELFYWCTSNQNIMILNVPPDEHGQIREHERLRILEVAGRLGIRGGKPLPAAYDNLIFRNSVSASSSSSEQKFSADKVNDLSLETWWTPLDTTASIEIDLQSRTGFNRIALMEHPTIIQKGDGFSQINLFNVKRYEIDVFDKEWTMIYTGNGIESCRIINFPEHINGSKIRLRILNSKAIPSISHISVADTRTKRLRK